MGSRMAHPAPPGTRRGRVRFTVRRPRRGRRPFRGRVRSRFGGELHGPRSDRLWVPTDLDHHSADGDGLIDVVWAVPEAPPTEDDPEPRAYIAEAEGMDTSGAALVAYMIEPLVAYPGTPICAVSDSAVTGLGQPVRIPVLANDVAPDGGSLDPASVEPRPVAGGELTVDAADGSLTFTPDPGFAGSVAATYVVYDNWRIGVPGEVTLTVEVDCTITIAEETVEVVGTEGDDVICADDLGDTSSWEDYNRFHIIDALGGDDIILGGNGTDWIHPGEGDDVVYGRAGDDRITADDGDRIYGGPGYDTIYTLELPLEVIDHPDGHHIEVSSTIIQGPLAPVAVHDQRHLDPLAKRVIEVLDNDHDPNGSVHPSTLSLTGSPTAGSARVVYSPPRRRRRRRTVRQRRGRPRRRRGGRRPHLGQFRQRFPRRRSRRRLSRWWRRNGHLPERQGHRPVRGLSGLIRNHQPVGARHTGTRARRSGGPGRLVAPRRGPG